MLPTGSLPDATKRYLKNSGKDKTPALVESGQGKFFNGTSQYINTGIIPNQAEGTLVTRFTYVTGTANRCIIGTSEVSIWVNASGKIEGLFGNAVITSTDVLVNGRSYHVSLAWSGLTTTLKVDNVVKASGTASSFAPTLPLAIGGRLLTTTPTLDRYFNNVIDETYCYDVALDSQISLLYLYPEKVKSYNGAIVPDIGSEANCKLFLPMCENSGSNVYNVAVNYATALALVNYTTTQHTSAAKLSYGAQCTAWKRDSLGVLLGMSNGLSFDKNVSVKPIILNGLLLPASSTWAVCVIIYANGLVANTYDKFIWGGHSQLLTIERSLGSTSVYIINAMGVNTTTSLTTGWHFIIADAKGEILIDGISKVVGTPTSTTTTIPFYIGGEVATACSVAGIVPLVKIFKDGQYAKLNYAKAWANASKIIAKLEA